MFTGRTLTELASELDRQANSKKDFMAPTSLMEMSVRQPSTAIAESLKKGGKPLEQLPTQSFGNVDRPTLQFRLSDKFTGGLTENMHDQLSKWTGIPGRYYDLMRKTAPALAAANVNHWLRANQKETRMVRTLDGNARAFLSNRYRPIDNYDVANAALPVLLNESKKLGQVEIMSSDVTENKLYIKVASKRLTYEVKKGDVVQMGIVISNSEVGHGSVKVEPFLYRLICFNGAIIEDSSIRKYHVGRASAELEAAQEVYRDETRQQDDKAFLMKLGDVVRASFNDENFAKLKGTTIDATTRKIKAPIQDVVEEIAAVYKFSDKHKDSFLKNLIEGGDISQWGVVNAITAIANTTDTYEDATWLEQTGGKILTLDQREWSELTAAA